MFGHGDFKGDLKFIGLADLFQILAGNRGTGVLQLKSRYATQHGLIYFMDGSPQNATYGSLRGLEAIYAMFGWTEGQFEFESKQVQKERVIQASHMQIVLDALRMLDDGDIERVGPDGCYEDAAGSGGKPLSGQKKRMPVIKGPLVDYTYIVDEQGFDDGEKIVTEGGHGSWIWVVLEGRVNISKETSRGPMTIALLGEGSFIGTFTSLLFSEYSRTATATAVGRVHLGLLDIQRLAGEYSSLSNDFRTLLFSLAGRLKKITERATALPEVDGVMEAFIKDKKMIIEKGSARGQAFTIKRGEIFVMGQDNRGYFSLLMLAKEDVFGFVPFIEIGHEPDGASVFASRDLDVDELNTGRLQREYEGLSGTLKNLIDHVSYCITTTTRLSLDSGRESTLENPGSMLLSV